MFYPANLAPENSRWYKAVQDSLTSIETEQPRLDSELALLQKDNQSVINDVTSRVNDYYTNTLAQYPVFEYSVLLSSIIGASTTVSVSAPAAANQTVSENWVDFFSHNMPLPTPRSAFGVRLNSAQFKMSGPSGYAIKFRWWIGVSGTGVPEGINITQWMSRHNFFLTPYSLTPGGSLFNIENRYAYRSTSSTSVVQLKLQGCIENESNRSLAVAAQNVTLTPVDNSGNDTYLDVMVTV